MVKIIKMTKVSHYYGSHREYGEDDEIKEFKLPDQYKKEAEEFELKHGHFSSNHEEFMTKFQAEML